MAKSWYTPATSASELEVSLDDVFDTDRRKDSFRNIGRNIHRGSNTDTAATIGRALEKAFRAGIEAARLDPNFSPASRKSTQSAGRPATMSHQASVIDEKSISSRGSSAMYTLSLILQGGGPGHPKRSELNPVMLRAGSDFSGKPLWIITSKLFRGDTIGKTTLNPMIKLGLLIEFYHENELYLTMTARGVEYCVKGQTSYATSDEQAWRFVAKDENIAEQDFEEDDAPSEPPRPKF